MLETHHLVGEFGGMLIAGGIRPPEYAFTISLSELATPKAIGTAPAFACGAPELTTVT